MSDLLDVDDTTWLLRQWAAWALTNPGLSLNYPVMSSYWKLVARRRPSRVIICDEQACQVERILCRLTHRDEEMGTVTMCYYLLNENASKTARVLSKNGIYQLNRQRVGELTNGGTAWIDAKLDSMRERKEVA